MELHTTSGRPSPEPDGLKKSPGLYFVEIGSFLLFCPQLKQASLLYSILKSFLSKSSTIILFALLLFRDCWIAPALLCSRSSHLSITLPCVVQAQCGLGWPFTSCESSSVWTLWINTIDVPPSIGIYLHQNLLPATTHAVVSTEHVFEQRFTFVVVKIFVYFCASRIYIILCFTQ